MIIPIQHIMDWELIRQRKQSMINKDNICENIKRVDYNYKVSDKIMPKNKSSYEYETPHTRQFNIAHMWTNDKFMVQMG